MVSRDKSSVPWVESGVEARDAASKRYAPATQRNRDAIAAVLRTALPSSGTVLEIASGSGEHVVHFAREFAGLTWVPSDPDAEARGSVLAWTREALLANIGAPLALDASVDEWPIMSVDAIVCINMVHISPWESTLGLMRGAAKVLPASGVLYLYGPYRREGVTTAPSNEAFDASLRSRDARWGLRSLEEVSVLANASGLQFESVTEMPANNVSVVFRKRS